MGDSEAAAQHQSGNWLLRFVRCVPSSGVVFMGRCAVHSNSRGRRHCQWQWVGAPPPLRDGGPHRCGVIPHRCSPVQDRSHFGSRWLSCAGRARRPSPARCGGFVCVGCFGFGWGGGAWVAVRAGPSCDRLVSREETAVAAICVRSVIHFRVSVAFHVGCCVRLMVGCHRRTSP